MPDEETLVEIDLDILHWTVKETREYRAAVGVNPEYAIGALKVAADDSAAEAKRPEVVAQCQWLAMKEDRSKLH